MTMTLSNLGRRLALTLLHQALPLVPSPSGQAAVIIVLVVFVVLVIILVVVRGSGLLVLLGASDHGADTFLEHCRRRTGFLGSGGGCRGSSGDGRCGSSGPCSGIDAARLGRIDECLDDRVDIHENRWSCWIGGGVLGRSSMNELADWLFILFR